MRVVAPEASPAERDAAGAGGFAGRHEDGVFSAAAEWLALASCDIVVGSQGSAYSLTASMRSGGLAVVLAPGSGVAIASTGGHQSLALRCTAPCPLPSPPHLTALHRTVYHSRR